MVTRKSFYLDLNDGNTTGLYILRPCDKKCHMQPEVGITVTVWSRSSHLGVL